MRCVIKIFSESLFLIVLHPIIKHIFKRFIMNLNLKNEKLLGKLAMVIFLGVLSGGIQMFAGSSDLGGGITLQQQDTKQIEGIVLDENRQPVAGASVAIADDLSVGTITDVDGEFSISVPGNSDVIVSFIGYKDAVVPTQGVTYLEVQLIPDAQVLNEVVVTALGITRESKSLGYAMQEVDADGLQENKAVSVANMLQGKIAGVQISQSGSGMGGSTRIIMRGMNSLSGANQPLWVVDGVPINDGTTQQAGQWGGKDYAGSASQINPEDIESISVLKGANAAALYGSRAQSGAIIITTKKGKYGQPLQIEYNGNVEFTSLYKNIYGYQNVYGQGADGIWNGNSNTSWGPKMEGQMVTHWQVLKYNNPDYSEVALTPQPDYLHDFFNTGVSYNNSVTASAGGEHLSGRISFTDSRNDGVTPNHSIDRQFYDINTEFKSKWLTIGAKVNYMRERTENAPEQGVYSLMNQLNRMPRGIRLVDLKNAGLTDDGIVKNWSGLSSEFHNPYGVIMPENGNLRERNRIIGQLRANIRFTDWLNLTGRVGIDWFNDKHKVFTYNPLRDSVSSQYYYGQSDNQEINADLILNFNKTFNDFTVTANLGTSVYNTLSDSVSGEAGTFQVPGFHWMSNGSMRQASEGYYEKEIQSVFGNVSVSYKDMLYLDITGRNDWSSTLPSSNWSYFYPSVSLSAIVSEMVEMPEIIDFLKIRGSWAMVGNDTGAYQLDYVYGSYPRTEVNGTLLEMYLPDTYPLRNLKPEQTTSWEVGLDYRMFNDRLGIDFTYYNSHTTNQILSIGTSVTSGYVSKNINAGNIKSQGYEVMLYGTPVLTGDWQWDVNINWGLNRTTCLSLDESIKRHTLGSMDIASVVIEEGGRYGDIVANNAYKRNDAGQILIDDNGMPIKETDKVIGNMTPDWTGSFGTTLRWKGISLYALFDVRCGGDFISLTDALSTAAGTSARTLSGRDGTMVVDGIVESTGLPNTKQISSQAYWTGVGGLNGVAEEFMYDGSYIKLRELSLGWSLPSKWLHRTPLKSVRISAVARDLCFIFKNAPVNPEGAIGRADSSQAFELGSLPPTRTMGFSLNVKF